MLHSLSHEQSYPENFKIFQKKMAWKFWFLFIKFYQINKCASLMHDSSDSHEEWLDLQYECTPCERKKDDPIREDSVLSKLHILCQKDGSHRNEPKPQHKQTINLNWDNINYNGSNIAHNSRLIRSKIKHLIVFKAMQIYYKCQKRSAACSCILTTIAPFSKHFSHYTLARALFYIKNSAHAFEKLEIPFKDVFLVCNILVIKYSSDYAVNFTCFVQKFGYCGVDINYIEYLILKSQNYNLNLDGHEIQKLVHNCEDDLCKYRTVPKV
ncbi:hypothetical protein ENBRE01_1288 [Enteropsectra breve]|nr:hypothetical protein ENBRE01_1288 [Enteropsectra breve]